MKTTNETLLEELEALKASIQAMIERVKGGGGQVETQDDDSGTNPPGNPPVKPPGGN